MGMQLQLDASAAIGKKLTTQSDKAGDAEIVTCRISVKGLRVTRDQMDELSGLPIGTTAAFFNELGQPMQRVSFLLPKRELIASGTIEHRKESGASIAKLSLQDASVADLRFNLDIPGEQGPTAILSFTVCWKAAGDEVDDVRYLLRRSCYLKLKLTEPPQQMDIEQGQQGSAKGDGPGKGKVERKRLAAGETKEEAETPPPAPVVGDKFIRDVQEAARKNPRRPAAKAKGGGGRKGRR